MDDLAHEHVPSLTQNPRKRKADGDDGADSSTDVAASSDSLLVDASSVPPCGASNAPRKPWLASDAGNEVWPSPTSPTSDNPLSAQTVAFVAPPSMPVKRPRIERPHVPTLRRSPRRHASSSRVGLSRAPSKRLRRGDVHDTGIVSTKHPGPTSGSLLRRNNSSLPRCAHGPSFPLVPIDPNSPHIPSPQPLINRQTLKELDLDAILRNPQLRHDLLFDAGLQFRPTSSRRKRDMAENYWLAVIRELETGCTCVSFDLQGKPHSLVCACGQLSLPSLSPILAFSSSLRVLTLRMPSRIRPLLAEFLEVLLSVIQPLSSISGMYVNPNTFQTQMQEHSAQAAHMRSVFDPELIEQELRHELFDPSGLFRSIGNTLKSHCAPMRDRAVEAMVDVALSCAPGGKGTKADAVKAVRMCMDILELMKLDIANHQLQTLRPFLIRTSGQFELKTFRGRKGRSPSLRLTREWLQTAHRGMLASEKTISHPLYSSGPLLYQSLQRNQQAYISALKALTDLVFTPPSLAPSHPPTASPPANSALPGYPETSYLDGARLVLLSTDAADITAVYMYLLLYRQLVFSESGSLQGDVPKVEDSELSNLKTEIRDIGSSHLGYCFTRGCIQKSKGVDGTDPSQSQDQDAKDWEKWNNVRQDVVLQVAMRAQEAKNRGSRPPAHPSSERSSIGQAPSEQILKLAERWSDTNMQPGSTLSVLLRDRLRDVVFNAVVSMAYPARDATTGKLAAIDSSSLGGASINVPPIGTATGMEPLVDEIRSLAERLSRLALIHLNAYLPIYEEDGFLVS
jgi:hypothetical protein